MASNDSTPDSNEPSVLKLVGAMAVFVLLGFPLVGYLWKTINDLLALQVGTTRLLLSIPVAILLAALLWGLSKAVSRWQDVGSQ